MNKKIWSIILGIFIIGIGLTFYTHNWIREEHPDFEIKGVMEPAASAVPEPAKTQPADLTLQESLISPLETTVGRSSSYEYESAPTEHESETKALSYDERLTQLDAQVERMREEEPSSNSYSLKNIVAAELHLWEDEKEFIYQQILEQISVQEQEHLLQSEKDWLAERRDLAIALAGKNSGSTVSVDSLEYQLAMTVLTRQRVYDLVTEYRTVLEES